MIVRRSDRVLVHGIGHPLGAHWARRMAACGTRVVGGVGWADGQGAAVPVYPSARQAMRSVGFDAAVLFTPPAETLDAARDVVEAGARLLVVVTGGLPEPAVAELMAMARANGVRLVGPGSRGLYRAGECVVGALSADRDAVFRPGRIGVVARSGRLGAAVCRGLVRGGFGASSFYGLGRGATVGTTMAEAVQMLADDPATDAIVLVGETGGTQEEQAAAIVARTDKPVIAHIADDGTGAARAKRSSLVCAGAIVCPDLPVIAHAVRAGLKTHRGLMA